MFLLDREFDAMISINSNDPSFDYVRGRAALKKLDAVIDHYFFGKNWCKCPSNIRTFFFAAPEHAGGKLHYHLLLKIPAKARRNARSMQSFEDWLRKTVKTKLIFPSGDVHVMWLTGGTDISDSDKQFHTACYVVKRQCRDAESENYVLSTEFHGPSSRNKL